MEGKRSVSKKSPKWSYKEKGPGLRFMFLMDGKRRIRKLWGGYSPKMYDGDFIKMNKEFFEEHCSGVGIVGDIHFETGPVHTPNVQWLVPVSQPRGRKRKNRTEPVAVLTKKQQYIFYKAT
jgi:hypothetical protein